MPPSPRVVPLSSFRPLARESTVPAESESAFFCENRRNRRHGFDSTVPAEKPAALPGELCEEPLDAEVEQRGLLPEGRRGRLRRAWLDRLWGRIRFSSTDSLCDERCGNRVDAIPWERIEGNSLTGRHRPVRSFPFISGLSAPSGRVSGPLRPSCSPSQFRSAVNAFHSRPDQGLRAGSDACGSPTAKRP